MSDKSKRQGRQTAFRESDSCIVPQKPESQSGETKPSNVGEGKAAKPSRDADRTSTVRSDGPSVFQRLDRITERANKYPEEAFDNVFSLLTYELLWMAFRRLQRDKAPGVDGVTVDQYEENLRANLQGLEARLHRQAYRPHPSLRKGIPKGKGKTRPLGIACVEDKIVQRAIVMILERIYEVDFSDASFGFRPGLSCHDALKVLGRYIGTKKVNWISDADIKGFFDNVCHERLRAAHGTSMKMLAGVPGGELETELSQWCRFGLGHIGVGHRMFERTATSAALPKWTGPACEFSALLS